MTRIWAAAIFAAVIGCGSDPGSDAGLGPDGPPGPITGVVELGRGTTAWQPLANGAEFELHAGPQGGHHFIVHARMADLIPGDPTIAGALGNPRTRFSAFLDGEQVDQNLPAFQLGYEDLGDGFFYLASGRLLILREEFVDQVIGAELTIRLDVVDVSGGRGREEKTFTIVEAPPIDLPDAGPPPDSGADTADAG